MSKYVLLDDVHKMLDNLILKDQDSGMDEDSAVWDDGWNRAINKVDLEVAHLLTVDMVENQFALKPCPFCGNQEIKSRYYNAGVGEYRLEIGCEACDYHMITTCYMENECVSLGEIIKLSNKAIAKWNRRYNESENIIKNSEEEGLL